MSKKKSVNVIPKSPSKRIVRKMTAIDRTILETVNEPRLAYHIMCDVNTSYDSLNRWMGKLESQGFVKSGTDGKHKTWVITEKGTKYLGALRRLEKMVYD